MITVRKLQLVIINEDDKLVKEQYKFIRDSQYAQYLALNKSMGFLGSEYMRYRDLKCKEYIESVRSFKYNLSNKAFEGINFGIGIDTLSLISQKVKKDFTSSLKNGLASGERSITNYKRTFPLMTRGKNLKFYCEDEDIFIKWVHGVTFKVVLSKKHHKNYVELQHFLRNILNGTYGVNQSTFEFNKNNKLILNLNATLPDTCKGEIIEGRVVGIDLGMKIPAYVALNDVQYIGQGVGCIDDLLKVRQQFNSRNDRLKKRMKLTKGGHGRKQKLKALNGLTEKEKNYVKTYNHMVSKRVIEFAKKNQAGQINMELLALQGTEKESTLTTIRWWSYYQLKEMIEYKAKREGIVVKYIDPYHTSQTCSICGHFEEGQREVQDKFKCKNPKCNHEENADRNAARNIAKSTRYITKKEQGQYYKLHKEN